MDGDVPNGAPAPVWHAWLDAVVERHTAAFSRPEFLKATRALSARYVETRAALPARSPLDSAGKRAAFAGYFTPLHFLMASAVIEALPMGAAPAHIVDLGAGTGAAGLAWATVRAPQLTMTGVDLNAWVLEELRWNARALNVPCRTERGDVQAALRRLLRHDARSRLRGTGIICGWSLNELVQADRQSVCDGLLEAASHGALVVVLEPLARSAVPWWREWQRRVEAAGGRADEWRLPVHLPGRLADLDRAAGFRREYLTLRSTMLDGRVGRR